MSNLTSASGEASATTSYPQQYFSPSQTRTHDETPAMKRRNPPGKPDLEAEIIALSPHEQHRHCYPFLSRLRPEHLPPSNCSQPSFSRFESVTPARIEEHGFDSTTISDILQGKGKGADGSWLWCTTDDTVYEAVKSMTQNNVGALVVVKPGEEKSIAGIITERDYLRKIIVQGRSSKSTKVGDIMTEENKLITVPLLGSAEQQFRYRLLHRVNRSNQNWMPRRHPR